ncbi:MAG: hypothetical protein MZV65_19895 [Chromatiales bacterium]|nr:hypothetical protein [Chromatiales bacterium]
MLLVWRAFMIARSAQALDSAFQSCLAGLRHRRCGSASRRSFNIGVNMGAAADQGPDAAAAVATAAAACW